MGATNKYQLPWPAPAEFLKDGATAIRALAEQLEDVLLPPLLATNSSGEPSWGGPGTKEGLIAWDLSDNPLRKRGAWSTGGAAERAIQVPSAGWYMVSCSFRFGGKAEPDTCTLAIESRDAGSDVNAGLNLWLQQRVEIPAQDTGSYTQIAVTSLVRVQDDQRLQVRVSYTGATQPPATANGANKLRIVKVSAL